MIDLDEARYALSVAREYAEEGNHAACAAVVEKLIGMFPPSYRFGRDVALAIGAPEWGIDWAGLDAEITAAVDAQLRGLIRAKEAQVSQLKKNSKGPRNRPSPYPAWMHEIARERADNAHLSASRAAEVAHDAIRTRDPVAALPSLTTLAEWIRNHRRKK